MSKSPPNNPSDHEEQYEKYVSKLYNPFELFSLPSSKAARGEFVCSHAGCDFACDSHMGLASHRRVHLKAAAAAAAAKRPDQRTDGGGDGEETKAEEKATNGGEATDQESLEGERQGEIVDRSQQTPFKRQKHTQTDRQTEIDTNRESLLIYSRSSQQVRANAFASSRLSMPRQRTSGAAFATRSSRLLSDWPNAAL